MNTLIQYNLVFVGFIVSIQFICLALSLENRIENENSALKHP